MIQIKKIFTCIILLMKNQEYICMIFSVQQYQQYYQLYSYSLMVKKQFFKNSACALFGLTAVLISAFFMTKSYYDEKISSQIQTVSLLKDIKLQQWGQQPNPSGSLYTQNFTLYSHKLIDEHILSEKSSFTKNFNYTYQYTNVSYTQGDSGNLNYIEHWQLKEVLQNNTMQIQTINFGADKIYNYDYYAPPQRKLTIVYNYLKDFLSNQFLQLFYAQYLYQYFFKDQNLVINTVFLPLNYNVDHAKAIYEHEKFGWNSVQKFKNWAVLSLKGLTYARNTLFYEQAKLQLGITSSQIQKLLHEKSTLFNMIAALNGTIKGKLLDKTTYRFKCSQDACSNEQLAGMEIANGFLTKEPIFASLSLQKTIKQMNLTIPSDIQYSLFCQKHRMLNKIPQATLAYFFTSHIFSDFEKMDFLWKNQDKFSQIQKTFNIPDKTGQSLIAYVMYLYESLIKTYEHSFSWAQTNYNNLEPTVEKYQALFLTELYSRGLYTHYVKSKPCEDYFVKDLVSMVSLCNNDEWNFVSDIDILKKYIKAYFYLQGSRQILLNVPNVTSENLVIFFHDTEKSLFAKYLVELNVILKNAYQCEGSYCEPDELFCKQWGQNEIFTNLPSTIYDKNVSCISEWDQKNIFFGFNPDFVAYQVNKLSIRECKIRLSSSGIFSFFNLLSIAGKQEQKNEIDYISKLVTQVSLQGIIVTSNASQLLTGYPSSVVDKKRNIKIGSGGAPWLSNTIALAKTNNKNDIQDNLKLNYPQFSVINTGLQNQADLRHIQSIWGETNSSSKYLLYQGSKEDDEGQQIQVNLYEKYVTDRIISGTNLLGFHPHIKKEDNLQIYFQQAYQSLILIYQSDLKFTSPGQSQISSFKYTIDQKMTGKLLSVQIEELNQNFIEIMNSSYFIVEPTTGITLEFALNYRVSSKPLFLENLSESDNIIIYESVIKYQRHNTSTLSQISSDISLKNILIIVQVLAGGVFFILAMVLVVLCAKSKDYEKKDTLLMNSQETE